MLDIPSNNSIKLFFFDTETTGTDPQAARIIQFGGIFGVLDANTLNFSEVERINQLVNVKEIIPTEASRVHGIKNEDLVEYGYIDDYIYEFLSLVKKADYVIGHNVNYDKTVLISETERLGIPFDFSRIHWVDTMEPTVGLVKVVGKNGKYKRPKLMELYTFLFGRGFEDAHDAMADITATKDCFLELVKNYGYFRYIFNSNDNVKTTNIDSYKCSNKEYKKISDIKLKGLLKSSKESLFLKGVEYIRDDQLKYILDYKQWNSLFLDDLLIISDLQAKFLSDYECGILSLDGIKNINKTQAEYLGKHNGLLGLNGLNQITDEQMEGLCNSICDKRFPEANIHLDGLKSITDKQAEYLGNLRGFFIGISLAGLTEISDNQLKLLLNMNGSLILTGLKSITDKQAEYLSEFEGQRVEIRGVENFTEKQKQILAKSKSLIIRCYNE